MIDQLSATSPSCADITSTNSMRPLSRGGLPADALSPPDWTCKHDPMVSKSACPVAVENAKLRDQVLAEKARREQAERALLTNEHALTDVRRISRAGSWYWDVQTGVGRASIEFFRILEAPYEDGPIPPSLFEIVHPDDRTLLRHVLRSAIVKRGVFTHEFRVVIRGGKIKYLLIEGHPDSSDPGDLKYAGAVIDVSEHRHLVEALKTAQTELSRSLRFATMGELAASIIHEINQPLTGLMANSETCLRWLSRPIPGVEQACQAVRRTMRDAERMIGIVKGLKSRAWKTAFNGLPVDIDRVIQEAASSLRDDLEHNVITLDLRLNAGRRVYGDHCQLQQVLINLMRNSIDAVASVVDRPRHLQVTSMPNSSGTEALITVRDNGIGFDFGSIHHIYEPMFTTKKEGMGMGLSISKSIVKVHGGELVCLPDEENGAAFQFDVPYFI
jgi:signal transduction histidine kinase